MPKLALQWDYVIKTVLDLAEEDPNKHERSLFIMTALYSMYLRISELSASERWIPQMITFIVTIVAHAIFGIGLYGAALFLVLLARS